MSYCMWYSAWVCRLLLAVVLWSCVVSRVHCVKGSNSNFHTVHAAHNTTPQDHSQPQTTHPGRTPHAVGHGLILLMMGIMITTPTQPHRNSNTYVGTTNHVYHKDTTAFTSYVSLSLQAEHHMQLDTFLFS